MSKDAELNLRALLASGRKQIVIPQVSPKQPIVERKFIHEDETILDDSYISYGIIPTGPQSIRSGVSIHDGSNTITLHWDMTIPKSEELVDSVVMDPMATDLNTLIAILDDFYNRVRQCVFDGMQQLNQNQDGVVEIPGSDKPTGEHPVLEIGKTVLQASPNRSDED